MTLRRSAIETIVAHARGESPRECCGILLAEGHPQGLVTRALPAENAETEQPEQAYRMGHQAHLRAVKLEAEGNAAIAGYYHSHPRGGAAPSPQDAALAVEDTRYLIVGLRNGGHEVAAWRFDGQRFVPAPLIGVE